MNEVMHQRAECRWWLLCCLSFHSCPTGNPSAHPGCCPGPRNPSQATLRAHSAHQITFKILISRGSMELWIWPKADCLGEVRRAKKEFNQFLPCGAVPGLALELPGVPWEGEESSHLSCNGTPISQFSCSHLLSLQPGILQVPGVGWGSQEILGIRILERLVTAGSAPGGDTAPQSLVSKGWSPELWQSWRKQNRRVIFHCWRNRKLCLEEKHQRNRRNSHATFPCGFSL